MLFGLQWHGDRGSYAHRRLRVRHGYHGERLRLVSIFEQRPELRYNERLAAIVTWGPEFGRLA